jgi:hypothetical protein
MHWIEQLFGSSPDGDSGLTELLLFLVPAVAFLIVRSVRRRRREVE